MDINDISKGVVSLINSTKHKPIMDDRDIEVEKRLDIILSNLEELSADLGTLLLLGYDVDRFM